jgi:hypothetical protein
MKKRTLQLTLATVLFGALAITASAESHIWIQSSGTSSETLNSVSSQEASGESKQVQSQTYQFGDELVTQTKEVIIKDGIKTTKIKEERTKDGHTNVTTQTTTEKLKNPKCCGRKKLKKCFKKLNKDDHCEEKCNTYQDDQGNIVLDQSGWALDENHDAHRHYNERAARKVAKQAERAKKMAQKARDEMNRQREYLRKKYPEQNEEQRIKSEIQKSMQELGQELRRVFAL